MNLPVVDLVIKGVKSGVLVAILKQIKRKKSSFTTRIKTFYLKSTHMWEGISYTAAGVTT